MTELKLLQAVILAGGRGLRLRPLTDTVPKPMIGFHGRPFLEYLINNLREQGILRILLLLGYLPEVIKNYFGNGDRFGVHIDYSITDEKNDTGKRIKLAESQIDEFFMLMYCDNYWPLRLRDMLEQYERMSVEGQITIYSNKDDYTRNNVRIENGFVVQYDKSRIKPGLRGVDIGYALFKKTVLSYLPDDNILFEKTIYPKLVESMQLAAYTTDHRYYSVSSFERLGLTETFLHGEPSVILDRDGVLNKKAPKAYYVRNWDEFEWLPGAKESIRLLANAGYKIIVITNQAGISRGIMKEEDLLEIHEKMKKEIEGIGGSIDAFYYCPHHWDENCECRKPSPGMLFQAQRDFSLDLTRTYFIGDDIRDEQAGRTAGCKTILLSPDLQLLQAVHNIILKTKN